MIFELSNTYCVLELRHTYNNAICRVPGNTEWERGGIGMDFSTGLKKSNKACFACQLAVMSLLS